MESKLKFATTPLDLDVEAEESVTSFSFSMSPSTSPPCDMDDNISLGSAESANIFRTFLLGTSFDNVQVLEADAGTSAYAELSASAFIRPLFFSQVAQEVLEKVGKVLIESVGTALSHNLCPVELEEGVTGGFLMKRFGGGYAAVFKPEEALSRRSSSFMSSSPRCKAASLNGDPSECEMDYSYIKGVKFGDCSVREVAAYLLDHQGFANIPVTVMVKINSKVFNLAREVCHSPDLDEIATPMLGQSRSPKNRYEMGKRTKSENDKFKVNWKIGSLQIFVNHDDDACDISCTKFDVAQVHRIGIFDVRVMNLDRHEGNILVKLREAGNYSSGVDLTPIDHGVILPDFEDINLKGNFCWMTWPQSKVKFDAATKEYIRSLDSMRDCQLLIKILAHRISLRGLMSLRLGTLLLKICVLEFDMSLHQIGRLIVGDWASDIEAVNEKSIFQQVLTLAQEHSGFHDPIGDISGFLEHFSFYCRQMITSSSLL